jgi:exoribonuclease R
VIARLRRSARALAIDWPADEDYPDFIRSLDPMQPRHIAMMVASTSVLRGAGYTAFNGTPPEPSMHGALASEYAHVTAPLRRLVDRYTGEICLAICAGRPTPPWVFGALPGLPATMRASDRLAGKYERAVLDLVEAIALAPRIGEVFDGAIVEVKANDPKQGVVMIREPAIDTLVSGPDALPLGAMVKVRLVEADPQRRSTRFEWMVGMPS